ncbi:MAG: deoxyribodipyrimidine photo-lyase [Planctomycetota bacterium]
MRALVWFRADLRVADNTALTAACRRADGGVVAVFTICPRQWLDLHDWADVKVGFLLRSLRQLSEELASLNIPLRILSFPTFAQAPQALLELARDTRCDALFFNDEYEVNELARDDAVSAGFDRAGHKVHHFTDQTLLRPGDVLTGSGGAYTVYSPFKRNCWAQLGERLASGDDGVLPAPGPQPKIDVASDPVPHSVEGFDAETDLPDRWPAGERAAMRDLEAFTSARMKGYKDQRDFPGIAGTSGVSHHLAVGTISPRQCVRAALGHNGGSLEGADTGAIKWIEEVLWREFYKHILVAFPHVCRYRSFRREYDAVEWRDDPEGLERWKQGLTGYPIVDAGMRQMLAEGWMHNRVRMIVATLLSKHLLLDWRVGERHFMRHLIDGDLANNNGGWQWSASVGTDAAPYFRVFNPFSQSRKFDAAGAYIRRWVPELRDLDDKQIHAPHGESSEGGGLFASVDYPKPIVDQKAARQRAIEHFKVFREG